MSARGVRRWWRVVAVVCATLVGVAVLQGASLQQSPPAQAADLSQFNPGDIIDDSLFWDANAMTAAQVQAFLVSKEPTCAAGFTCMKNYTESTYTIAGTPMCGEYDGAPNESAATIIARIGQLCGISQKVLLVILEKEQGLVTATAPSTAAYRSATGAGCPDTSACDANYYGFFNQVHYAAYLLKRYTQPAGTGPGTAYTTRFDQRYPVGQTSNVLYNPDANQCGSVPVYITNQATHALYIYTPYTPDAAALAAGYGTGDACSSYGNRNFYNYYTDWFGSTRGYAVGVYFTDYYAANSSWLGYPTAPMTCGEPDSGCVQSFVGGLVSGSYSTVAAGVHNDYLQVWGWYGREFGPMGYPLTEYRCDNMLDGCRQEFQGGWIVSTGGAIYLIPQATRVTWSNYGRDLGPLGDPTSAQICTDMANACRQQFTGGWIVQNTGSTVANVVTNAVLAVWQGWGREFGPLGLPTAAPAGDITTGNYSQTFQGGVITVTNGSAALTSTTDPWTNTMLSSPWLGSSTQAKSCTLMNGACYQAFQNGWIVQAPGGVFAVPSAVLNIWSAYGREYNILGFPSGKPSANPTTGNYTQAFQGGVITVTNGSAALTSTTDQWTNATLSPWLGSSTQAKSCTLMNGACYQAFKNGWVVQAPGGVFAVPNAVLTVWSNYGREYNILGFPSGAPSANPTTGNYTQAFQGGLVTVTNGAAVLTSTTDPWTNAVWSSTWLGSSTQAKSCTLLNGGCYQAFQNGWVVQGPAGVFAVPTAVLTAWGWYGRETNVLGYPSGKPSADPTTGNYTQAFQGGVITVTNGVPALTSTTDPWTNAILTSSWLGSSTQAKSCTLLNGACYQAFQNGWVVQSPAGVFAVPSAVLEGWGWYGREYDVLGFPSGAPSANPTSGNYTQAFQGGLITVTNGTPVVTVH